MKMAHMYQCKELVSACIPHLKGKVTKANSAELFAVAKLVDSKPLREAIFAEMIDFEKPLEGVRANGLKSHQDYEELISVWQNKHKELKTRFADSEKNLVRSDLSLRLSRQDTGILESKIQMLQGQINQRRSCNRCRNCRNC